VPPIASEIAASVTAFPPRNGEPPCHTGLDPASSFEIEDWIPAFAGMTLADWRAKI